MTKDILDHIAEVGHDLDTKGIPHDGRVMLLPESVAKQILDLIYKDKDGNLRPEPKGDFGRIDRFALYAIPGL